jgi:hypothetical protein
MIAERIVAGRTKARKTKARVAATGMTEEIVIEVAIDDR